MIRTKTILRWKKENYSFYLGKALWKTTHRKELSPRSRKLKNGKTAWSNYDIVSTKSRKYNLYRTDTDENLGFVTLDDVELMRKSGIKVYAEKDGFLC